VFLFVRTKTKVGDLENKIVVLIKQMKPDEKSSYNSAESNFKVMLNLGSEMCIQKFL